MRTKQELREYQRLYKRRPEVRARQQEYAKEYRRRPDAKEKQRERTRTWNLGRRGLDEQAYQSLFLAQSGVCAICHRPERVTDDGRLIRLAVDHAHDDGRVRGLLCGSCNRAVGLLRDDPQVLREAALYLEGTSNGSR